MKKTLITALCALMVAGAASPLGAQDGLRPAIIDFSKTLTQMRGELDPQCDTMTERRIDPPKIPGTKHQQMQIDCLGFAFEGGKRKAEFSFRDGQLALVWILTDAAEEPALRVKMEARYGKPSHVTDGFIAFASHHAALRRDIPEVLYYAPEVADAFTAWFDQQAKAAE